MRGRAFLELRSYHEGVLILSIESRAGSLASQRVALSVLVSAALGGKPACTSITPPCRAVDGGASTIDEEVAMAVKS